MQYLHQTVRFWSRYLIFEISFTPALYPTVYKERIVKTVDFCNTRMWFLYFNDFCKQTDNHFHIHCKYLSMKVKNILVLLQLVTYIHDKP